MFSSPTSENQSGKVQVEEYSVATMEVLIKHLYTGSVDASVNEKPEMVDLIEVCTAADYFGILELKDAAAVKMIETFELYNALPKLGLAYKLNIPVLKSEALDFVFENLEHFTKDPSWPEFNEKYPVVATDLLNVSLAKRLKVEEK